MVRSRWSLVAAIIPLVASAFFGEVFLDIGLDVGELASGWFDARVLTEAANDSLYYVVPFALAIVSFGTIALVSLLALKRAGAPYATGWAMVAAGMVVALVAPLRIDMIWQWDLFPSALIISGFPGVAIGISATLFQLLMKRTYHLPGEGRVSVEQ